MKDVSARTAVVVHREDAGSAVEVTAGVVIGVRIEVVNVCSSRRS